MNLCIQPSTHRTSLSVTMKTSILLSLSLFACASIVQDQAKAATLLFEEYRLGEPGTVGASNDPLDSVGTRHIDTTINPAAVTIGGPGATAGSSAFLDTSDPADSGYYHTTNFSDLPTDNFAIGVYAKAAALIGANQGTIFGTGDGGLDISLQANGWAGSVFNVAWVGEAGGVTGSFTPDTWTHLALVRADGITTFYVDGIAQPGTFDGAPVNGLPHVSVSPGGGSYFNGGIDEIRVVTFDAGESTSSVLGELTAVPEPSSLALLSIGFMFTLSRRRRRS